jgi:intracellular sulfur oxidation DsrE/DsrF family protein
MKRTVLAAAALTLVAVLAAVSQTASVPKHKVVFQMSEPEKSWDSLISHVTNLRKAFEKDGSQVEVVFFGDGLDMILKKDTAYEEGLKRLADSGVTLAACQNAMRFKNVKTEDLFPFVTQVDSGVAELTRKQEAGWSYIH